MRSLGIIIYPDQSQAEIIQGPWDDMISIIPLRKPRELNQLRIVR